MERFKIQCELSCKPVELQFDIKKMPGEIGPCYMVSVDGLFRGYIKRTNTGTFEQLMNKNFSEEDLTTINEELKLLVN